MTRFPTGLPGRAASRHQLSDTNRCTRTEQTTTSTPDHSALGLLATLQLADSAFPAGLYAASHGLESAVQEGQVRTASDLEHFLANWLAWQVGPGDAVIAAAAHRAAGAGDLAALLDIDAYNASTKLAREAREASTKSGRRLLSTAAVIAAGVPPAGAVLQKLHRAVVRGESPGTYAAAFGTAGAALGASLQATVLAELHGAATSLLGAALRLLRVDHQQTQTILRRQAPRLVEIAGGALAADWRDLCPSAPFAEIMQMRHETLHVRLFMS